MQAKHLVIAAIVVALIALATDKLTNNDASGLERLHKRADEQVDCKVEKAKGRHWGVCRYKDGSLASIWLERKGIWVAANDKAIEVCNQLPSITDKDLPNTEVDLLSMPKVPSSLLDFE